MKLCVLGLGYIGLPTSALFAAAGFEVHGVDIDPLVVDEINSGRAHIAEPGLAAVVADGVASGRMRASLVPGPADCFLIAVPTPFKANHVPNLDYVEAAAHAIAPYVQPGNLVILESTSPVGTTEKLARTLAFKRPDLTISGYTEKPTGAEPVYVAHCPERVLPGQIMRELVENDRVVGGLDPASAERAKALYQTVVKGRIHTCSARLAEMCKLAENTFRDVNIALANELEMIGDKIGIDVWELIRLANLHPRVQILQPGPGVGGHCIAVDPWFIVHAAPDEARIIRLARDINDGKPDLVVEKVRRAMAGIEAPTIACLGLAYKADTDDLRESPAVKIVESLARGSKAKILVVDPHVETLPDKLNGLVELTQLQAALHSADAIVLLVDHAVFRCVPRAMYSGKVVIDTRGVWRTE